MLNHLTGDVYKRYVIILEYGYRIEYVQKLIINIKNAFDFE